MVDKTHGLTKLPAGKINFAQVDQSKESFDYKLLNEGWKIGMRGNDFLPPEWKDPELKQVPFEYDSKLLNEGWKIGKRGNDFLPPEWQEPELKQVPFEYEWKELNLSPQQTN